MEREFNDQQLVRRQKAEDFMVDREQEVPKDEF